MKENPLKKLDLIRNTSLFLRLVQSGTPICFLRLSESDPEHILVFRALRVPIGNLLFLGLSQFDPEHLLVLKALWVQSETLPCFKDYFSNGECVQFGPRHIQNASNLEGIQSGWHPIWKASDPERILSGKRLIWNASDLERLWSGTRPIWNTSGTRLGYERWELTNGRPGNWS